MQRDTKKQNNLNGDQAVLSLLESDLVLLAVASSWNQMTIFDQLIIGCIVT